MSEKPELSRPIRSDRLPTGPVEVSASAEERRALALRFDIPAIHRLEATVLLAPGDGGIDASGELVAEFDQQCAVAGDRFRNRAEEAFSLRFVPHSEDGRLAPEEGIELEAEELDEIVFEGASFDIGEAVAQSFALAIDPYAEGPDAEAARDRSGIVSDDAPRGPLADALAALRKG